MLFKVARNTNSLQLLNLGRIGMTSDRYQEVVRGPDVAVKLATRYQQIQLDTDRNCYLDDWAVSAYEKFGLNDNADGFTRDELKRSYASFIDSWICIDHDNDHPSKSIGENIDAVYTPQDYVRVVMAIDRARSEKRHSGLERKIASGIITDTSMGSLVRYSICTIPKCANVASDEDQFCKHVLPFQKGGVRGTELCNADTNFEKIVCGELNFGVHFFENTIITEQSEGADNNAKIIERLSIRKAALNQARTGDKTISADKLYRAIHGMSKTASTAEKALLTSFLDTLLAE